MLLTLAVSTDALLAQRTADLLAFLTLDLSLTITTISSVSPSIPRGYMHHDERVVLKEHQQLLLPVDHQHTLHSRPACRDALGHLIIGVEYEDTVESVLVLSVMTREGVVGLDGLGRYVQWLQSE